MDIKTCDITGKIKIDCTDLLVREVTCLPLSDLSSMSFDQLCYCASVLKLKFYWSIYEPYKSTMIINDFTLPMFYYKGAFTPMLSGCARGSHCGWGAFSARVKCLHKRGSARSFSLQKPLFAALGHWSIYTDQSALHIPADPAEE